MLALYASMMPSVRPRGLSSCLAPVEACEMMPTALLMVSTVFLPPSFFYDHRRLGMVRAKPVVKVRVRITTRVMLRSGGKGLG